MTFERPSPARTLASRFRRTASRVSSRPDIPASAPWLLSPTAISTAVAAFRICVSAGALLVFTRGLGPASPPLITYVLVTYALYGVATLLTALQARPSVTAYPMDQLAADVLAYAAILYATGGIYSQFWPLCTVPVICSAMRTRPLDVTAVAVLMGSFVVATTFVHAPNILLYPIPAEVIRLRAVIQVGTIFLAIAFSAHSAQVFNRFRLLTLIPSGQEETAVEFGRACAGRYQSILSPTLTIIEFTAGGGPYRFVALADGTLIMETRPDAAAAATVVEAPARLALRRLGDVLDTPGEAIRQGLEGQKLSPDTVGAAILAPFHTRHGSGHVAVFDVNRRDLGDELVVISMARQIAGDLEAIRLSEHRKTLALHEQKIRFARDLHDGILQTMAGLGMQMQALIKASPDAGDQTAVQLSELKRLGMLPSLFPLHTYYWGDWHASSVLGSPRADYISPCRDVLKAGLTLTSHHDAPVTLPDALRVLDATVNRTTRSGRVLGPDQRLTPYEGLKTLTHWAAIQYFEEADKGTLTVGKRADLVILDKNPLKVPPADLHRIAVVRTIKDGRTVYAKGPA